MIDWTTAILPCVHNPINSGLVAKIGPDGEIIWTSACSEIVTGSWESSIQVKSLQSDGNGSATHLWFHGNPSKYLQGHNVFGSDDLLGLVFDAYMDVVNRLGISPTIDDIRSVRTGDYQISRVDINYSWQLPSRADVRSWIRAAEYKSRTRSGRPQTRSGTIYWQKNSRRWAFKGYSKADELESGKNHQLPATLLPMGLKEWADNKLRLELVLRSMELKEIGIHRACDLTPEKCRELHTEYLGRIDMNAQMCLSQEILFELPKNVVGTYLLWKQGEDLRDRLTKATYYRHRKVLLEHSIDIANAPEVSDDSNVIPLIRVVEATPAEIPSWAFRKGLVHQSQKVPVLKAM